MKISEIPWPKLDARQVELLRRLLVHTRESPATGCWYWQGAHAGSGMAHATVSVGSHGRQIGLNRLAWYIFRGMPLEGSKHIQIRKNTEVCEDKMCWNPDHYDSVDTESE